jgi:cytochrome P450
MQLHTLLDKLREDAPIVPVRFMGSDAWLITRHAELEQVFKDTESFPPHASYKLGIEPLIGETFQSMEDERNRFYRKLATPTFRPRMVERLDCSMLSDVAHELFDKFVGEGRADLASDFTERYPYIVIARLLGIPRDEEEKFARWVVGILKFNWDPVEAIKCRDELWAYLDPIIEQRRTEPQDDVISQLIHDELEGVRMTPEQVKSHIGIMFTAGSSTSHDSIGNLIYGLLTTQNYWHELVADEGLRDNAIEEALRWEAAVSVLPRLSRSDGVASFCGVDIQPNTFVMMGIAAANHDPRVFEDPHRFNIFRDSSKKITFGHGPRTCPGMHLARRELRVTLDTLLERLPNLRLTAPENAAPTGTIFRNPREVVCRF